MKTTNCIYKNNMSQQQCLFCLNNVIHMPRFCLEIKYLKKCDVGFGFYYLLLYKLASCITPYV